MNLTKNQLGMTVLIASLFLIQADADESPVLKTPQDMASYAAGVGIVRKLKQQGGEVNLDLVIQGMKDGLTDYKLLMSEDDIRAATDVRRAERLPRQAQPETVRDNGSLAGGKTEKTAPGSAPFVIPTVAAAQAAQEPQTEQILDQAGIIAAPGGAALSRRNRAKLNISQVKAEMRARALSGAGSQND